MKRGMYSKEIEEYSRQIPDEIKSAVRGLDHDIRCAILVCLLRNGGRLSFAELQEKLNISKGRLAYHLGLLIDGALVRNFSEISLKDRYNSYYEVTGFAMDFLENILRPITIARVPTLITFIGTYNVDLTDYIQRDHALITLVRTPSSASVTATAPEKVFQAESRTRWESASPVLLQSRSKGG